MNMNVRYELILVLRDENLSVLLPSLEELLPGEL